MMMKTEDMVVAAMNAFKAEIAKHNLDTLKNYPTDLEQDQILLARVAMPGAKFGWKVGHTGTHLYALGLHPRRNEFVTYVTRHSSSDRFYLLEFFTDRVKLTEKNAEAFEALAHTPVPYRLEGSNESFWLVKNGIRVGHCKNEFTGDARRKKYRSSITPMAGLSKLDREALLEFSNFCVVSMAGTLFVGQEDVWLEPGRE